MKLSNDDDLRVCEIKCKNNIIFKIIFYLNSF